MVEEALRLLRESGCDLAQGQSVSRPLPVAAADAELAAQAEAFPPLGTCDRTDAGAER